MARHFLAGAAAADAIGHVLDHRRQLDAFAGLLLELARRDRDQLVDEIGEFSHLARVTTKLLRHYDRIGLLPPSHVDADNGYRYYSADQLPRLNRILDRHGLMAGPRTA